MVRAPSAKNDEIDDCGMKQWKKDRARRMGAFGGRTKTTKETSTTHTNIFVENKSKHRTRQRSWIRDYDRRSETKCLKLSLRSMRIGGARETTNIDFTSSPAKTFRDVIRMRKLSTFRSDSSREMGGMRSEFFPTFRRDQRRVTLNDYIVRVTTRRGRSPCLCSRPRRHLPRPPALLLPRRRRLLL